MKRTLAEYHAFHRIVGANMRQQEVARRLPEPRNRRNALRHFIAWACIAVFVIIAIDILANSPTVRGWLQ